MIRKKKKRERGEENKKIEKHMEKEKTRKEKK